MPNTLVHIVCSPRPQVGRTLLCRVLTEYLLLQHGDVIAFDINLREPSLLDFLPKLTETADISDTFGKMALMDRLIINDGVPKVIDLGYHAFDEFFGMSEEIGFPKEAARRGVDPVVLYLPDHHRSASQSYNQLRHSHPLTPIVAIDNEHILQGEVPKSFDPALMLRLSALPPFLKTYFERQTFSFTQYLRQSRDATTELHQWTRRNYMAFRDIADNLDRYRL